MILLIFAVCLSASTLGGICGIGGGVVIKPILDAAGLMSVSTLSFLSGLTVFLMSVMNVWKNRKNVSKDIHRSLPLAVGAAAGGLMGKTFFQVIRDAVGSENTVGLVQSVLLGILVLGTLLYVRNKSRIQTRNIQSKGASAFVGAVLGLLSAFLGIGGGPMNLAVLFYFFSMDTKQAAINSMLVILLSQLASLGMTLATSTVPSFDWGILVAMASAGILGGWLSVRIQKKLSSQKTDLLFSAMLIAILLICAANAWKMAGA